jgi:Lar family restriction alleviation protein
VEEKISDEKHKLLVDNMDACPFCGVKDGDVMLIHFHHWVSSCRNCDAQGPVCSNPRKAVEAWNKRSKK